jgi:hypothetical protein
LIDRSHGESPISVGTIATSYLVAGLLPLAPYLLASSIGDAFEFQLQPRGRAGVFEAIKSQFTGVNKLKSAFQH